MYIYYYKRVDFIRQEITAATGYRCKSAAYASGCLPPEERVGFKSASNCGSASIAAVGSQTTSVGRALYRSPYSCAFLQPL